MHSGSQLTCSELCPQNKSSQWPLGGPFIESAHDLHELASQQDERAPQYEGDAIELGDACANGLTQKPAPSRWRIRSLRDKQRPNSSLPSYASYFSSFYRGSSAPIVKLAPNTMFPLGRSAQWRRPSRRHCVRYCIKCATVCESLKTVLDASLPSRTVHTLELRPSSVYRKFGAGREGRIEREE